MHLIITFLLVATVAVSSKAPPPPSGHRCLDWNFGGWSPILYHFQNGQFNRITPAASERIVQTPLVVPTRTPKSHISSSISSFHQSSSYQKRPSLGSWTPFYQSAPQDVSLAVAPHSTANMIRYNIRAPKELLSSAAQYHHQQPSLGPSYQLIPNPVAHLPLAPPVTRIYLQPVHHHPSSGYNRATFIYPVKRPFVKYMQIGRPRYPPTGNQVESYSTIPQSAHRPSMRQISKTQSLLVPPSNYGNSRPTHPPIVQQLPITFLHKPTYKGGNGYNPLPVHVKTDLDKPLNEQDYATIHKSLLHIGPHVDTIYHQTVRPENTYSTSARYPPPPEPVVQKLIQPVIQPIVQPVVQPVVQPIIEQIPTEQPAKYVSNGPVEQPKTTYEIQYLRPSSDQQRQPEYQKTPEYKRPSPPPEYQKPPQYQGPSSLSEYQRPPEYQGPPLSPEYQRPSEYQGSPPSPEYQRPPEYQGPPLSPNYQKPPEFQGRPPPPEYQRPSEYPKPSSPPSEYQRQPEYQGPPPPPSQPYAANNDNYANEQDSGLFKPLLDQSRKGKGYAPIIPYKNNDPVRKMFPVSNELIN